MLASQLYSILSILSYSFLRFIVQIKLLVILHVILSVHGCKIVCFFVADASALRRSPDPNPQFLNMTTASVASLVVLLFFIAGARLPHHSQRPPLLLTPLLSTASYISFSFFALNLLIYL